MGITTAYQLACADEKWIQKTFSIMLVRTVLELRGQKCFELEDVPEPNKNITVSRSFGKEVQTLEHLEQAISVYVTRAGEKLRGQQQYANVLTVFAGNNRFGNEKRYYNACSHIFETATDSSCELVRAAVELTRKVYMDGVKFKKAGVTLSKLVGADQVQLNLFSDAGGIARDKRLMEVMDRLNAREKNIFFGSEGMEKPWQTKFEHRSGSYTTSWEQLRVVE